MIVLCVEVLIFVLVIIVKQKNSNDMKKYFSTLAVISSVREIPALEGRSQGPQASWRWCHHRQQEQFPRHQVQIIV